MLDLWIWLRIACERKEWEKENNEDIIEDNWRRENVKWIWSRIGEMRDEITRYVGFLEERIEINRIKCSRLHIRWL